MRTTRRRFLEDSLLAAAALAAAPGLTGALGRTGGERVGRVRKSADAIRMGVVGIRGRGRAHIKAFNDSPDAVVVALCDPDYEIIGPAIDAAPEAAYYRDIRSMLERDDIDAISIATPNHWHSLAAVWALRAGKHVFVEKPISYDLGEGRVVVDTAERTGLVVQHGTQARSQPATIESLEWMRAGGLGDIKLARGLCYKRRESIGKVEGPMEPPPSCDYDLWTGPAALTALMRTNLHYDWHWDYNTGNGDIGNQGVHQLDLARWGLGKTGFPGSVTSCGGRFGYDDDGNTANTQVALLDYGDAQIIFEVRGLPTPGFKDTTIGTIFHCEGGYLVIANYTQAFAFDTAGKQIKTFEGESSHFQHFLDSVRRGHASDGTGTAWDGHVSSGLCHLSNISYRVGAERALASASAPFGASDDANETFERFREHLTEQGVDPRNTDFAMGPRLRFDAESERFTGGHAAEANALLHREHRDGYRFDDFG